MQKSTDNITSRLRSVPKSPGVYVLKDARGRVLYVGKAKVLRARLGSYFQKSASLDQRKQAMVRAVRDFSTIVTSNELEALALEATLIKQYKPRFNVILRDDKSYPYLRLTLDETWPRLEVVRRPEPQKKRARGKRPMYFGPYVPSSGMYELLRFVKRNFGLRVCRYRLDERKPSRPCIQHQMGRCPAPCAGLVTKEAYDRIVGEVISFLKGRRTELLEALRAEMAQLSEREMYEEAALCRDRIRALERAWERQKVISPELGDMDVVGLYRPEVQEGKGRAVTMAAVLFVRDGTLTGARQFGIPNVEGAPTGELLRELVINFYSKGVLPPPEVLLPDEAEDAEGLMAWLEGQGARVELRVPQRGKRHELVQMALENARAAYQERMGQPGPEEVMEELAQRLSLDEPPRSIGAFDVSNLTGSDPVGAYVVWEDGEFNKDGYRHVRIRDVEGIDDYAMMRETVRRVLKRTDPPGLIVVDGGRGHLDAVGGVLDEIFGAMSGDKGSHRLRPLAIGVAKKPDRAFLETGEEPVPLSGREHSSVLLRQVRDEVHRFGVTFHKKLRGKRLLESPLESVPGIGKKRRLALLRTFKSIESMREASVEELAAVEGMNSRAALALKEALNGESDGLTDEAEGRT